MSRIRPANGAVPFLYGYLNRAHTVLAVWCPPCNDWHLHHDLYRPGTTVHAEAACTRPGSPYRAGGYDVNITYIPLDHVLRQARLYR
ncbi:hypothetical protein ACFV3R_25125 [Streptomyces sp. NPDC059740]|uniref:hypothetical protein n=1 Tax=Streptomyces sp. NPDC059740 TaxID=3346926 RepID=UPI00365C542C